MSVEGIEARILARQMEKEVKGKTIIAYEIQNSEQLQRIGCVSEKSVFEPIVGSKILSVTSRGNTILIKLSNCWNIVLGPEYGGNILLHKSQAKLPKFHFKLDIQNVILTVSLKGIGCIHAVEDKVLKTNYLYTRDFSQILDPLEVDFTFERFNERLRDKKQNIKAALAGKNAVVVGVSNSAFQDIIYRAKINPKRNTGTFTAEEERALFKAITQLVEERLEAGGKNQFVDLYGKPNLYIPKMGPNKKDQTCSTCKSKIEKINYSGGQVCFCQTCQK
ncbi:MAG: hypothetical protein LBC12_08340 [Nitrososphaerota archaeon]|jgi:formamidopyrimidine-DNA glycosylase|nr:hypothetical protein [Nitrososphaerota archaeon]